MDEQTYKDALLKKRTEILGTGGIKPLQASMENNTRQGDMADQASGNNEVHIAAEAEADRRQDPAGDRRSAVADRKGHLRHVPRLRRADRAGAAATRSRGRASASPARKSRTRDRPAAAAPGILSREAGDAAAAPGRRAADRRNTTPTTPTSTSSTARRRSCPGSPRRSPSWAATVPATPAEPVRRPRGQGRDAAARCFEEDARDAAGVRRALAAARRRDDQRASREDAARHPRRDPRAEALLRAGARRPARSARPARRAAGPVARRGAALAMDRVTRHRARQQRGRSPRPSRLRRRRAARPPGRHPRSSRYYDTVPVGMSGPQAMFLNAAAVGETALAAARAARRAARRSSRSAAASAPTPTRRARSTWI